MSYSIIQSRAEKSCCSSNYASNTCVNFKIATCAITAAISVIVLYGATIAYLAKQGLSLGEINKIVSPIDDVLLYGTFSGATLIGVVDAIVILALARQLQESEKIEKEQHLINHYIQKHSLIEKMPPLSFWKLTGSEFFALLVKDQFGKVSLTNYLNRDERHAKIESLFGYINGKKELKKKSPTPIKKDPTPPPSPIKKEATPPPSPTKVEIHTPLKWEHEDLKDLSEYQDFEKIELYEHFYYTQEFATADGMVYALYKDGEPKTEYFKALDDRKAVCEELQKTHFSYNALLKDIDDLRFDYRKQLALTPFFVPLHRDINNNTIDVIIQNESWELFTASNRRKNYISQNKLVKAPPTHITPSHYNPVYGQALLTENWNNQVEQAANELKEAEKCEFIHYDILTGRNDDVFILIYNEILADRGESHIHYFDTQKARNDYFNAHVANYQSYCDARALHHFCYGVPEGMQGDKGIVSKRHLNELLVQPYDSYLCKSKLSPGKPFVWFYRKKERIKTKFFETIEKRDEAMRQVSANNLTPLVEKVDHSTFADILNGVKKELLLDKVLLLQGDYWLQPQAPIEDVTADILFYHDGERIQTKIFDKRDCETFKQNKGLQSDRKNVLNSSDEYPTELGEYLADQTAWTKKNMEGQKAKMSIREYFLFGLRPTGIAAYPNVFSILERNERGVYKFHYFKSDEAAETFWRSLEGYINAASHREPKSLTHKP